MQYGQVVEDPEAATLSRGDQVLLLYGEIGNGHFGQVELDRAPVAAIIHRVIDAELRSRVQQAFAIGIGSQGARKVIVRDAVGDFLPARAPVERAIQVRPKIIRFVSCRGQVGPARLERVDFQAVYLRPFRQPGGRYVRPCRAAVACDMHEAVVAAGPDHVCLMVRFRQRENRTEVFDAGVVLGNRSTGGLHAGIIIARQVRAHPLPGLAQVVAAKQHIRCNI